jgi:hypothetical protein
MRLCLGMVSRQEAAAPVAHYSAGIQMLFHDIFQLPNLLI